MAREDPNNQAHRLAELEAAVGGLLGVVDDLKAEIARKDGALIYQRDRIEELERALEDAHRRSKRQSAPFSKGDPKAKAKRSGRKPGDDHGRHGHRRVPTGAPDRDLVAPLPAVCPDCGGQHLS